MRPTVIAVAIVAALAAPPGTRAAAQGVQGGLEKLAFTFCYVDWYDFVDLVCNVYTANPDGSEWRPLTEGSGPAFSADGTKLAFALHGAFSMRNTEVSTIDLANGVIADLAGPHDWWFYPDQAPAWSPDGSRIAFSSDRDGALDLYVMNADGTGTTRLTHDAGFRGNPAWSRDGSRIAFDCVVEPGNVDICTTGPNGGSVDRLTTDPRYDGSAAFAPDGRIAFATSRYAASQWGGVEIAVMNADGTGVTRTGVAGSSPAWSPSGAQFAYESSSPLCDADYCNSAIGIANADGSDAHWVVAGSHPTWTTSPLARLLAPPIASFVPYECDVRTLCADTYSSWDDQAGPWPDSGIVEYRWDFGDGTTGTGPDPYHHYAVTGTYTVSLTVTDSDGLKTTQRQTLTIYW